MVVSFINSCHLCSTLQLCLLSYHHGGLWKQVFSVVKNEDMRLKEVTAVHAVVRCLRWQQQTKRQNLD